MAEATDSPTESAPIHPAIRSLRFASDHPMGVSSGLLILGIALFLTFTYIRQLPSNWAGSILLVFLLSAILVAFVFSFARRLPLLRDMLPFVAVPILCCAAAFGLDPTGQGMEALRVASSGNLFVPTLFILAIVGILLRIAASGSIRKVLTEDESAFNASLEQWKNKLGAVNITEDCQKELKSISSSLETPEPYEKDCHHIVMFCGLAVPLTLALIYIILAFRAPFHDWRSILTNPWSGEAHPLRGLIVCILATILIGLFHLVMRLFWKKEFQPESKPELAITATIAALGLGGGAISLAAWLVPELASYLGPVAILVLCVYALTATLNSLLTYGQFWALIGTVYVVFWVLGVLVRFGGGTFERYTLSVLEKTDLANTENAERHARNWILARLVGGKSPAPQILQPIFVIAEGGGMRAAAQTASILAELDQATEGKLYGEIYAMSGVSGGALGIASYVAAQTDAVPAKNRASALQSYLAQDYLSPLLIGLWFGDVRSLLYPLHLIGAPLRQRTGNTWLTWFLDRDRSFIFQETLEDRWGKNGKAMKMGFGEAIARSVPHGSVPPIVLLNTTNAVTGEMEVISNVNFLNVAKPAEVETGSVGGDLSEVTRPSSPTIDAPCNVLDRLPAKKTVSLAGAAVLSARFPGITPPGLIVAKSPVCNDSERVRVRYVDGGFIDNSGASAARAAFSTLIAAADRLKKEAHLNFEIRPFVIRIYAREFMSGDERAARGRKVFAMADLETPAKGLISARRIQGLAPVSDLCRRLADQAYTKSNDAQVNGLGITMAQLAHKQCDAIRETRAADRDDQDMSIITKYCKAGGLPWLNAELMVSTYQSDAANYVPLGWLLGSRSRTYIAEKSKIIVQKMLANGGTDTSLQCLPNWIAQPTIAAR